MIDVYKIVNVKNSLRNLSDEKFELILPQLAEEISKINIEVNYQNEKLKHDWKSLNNWTSLDNSINSTSRFGMKLCEHFFPNFFDIENNRGQSFRNLWVKDNLIKILRWNRKSHSTPYLSELKRGIYFCCGLTKNTMYRPQMAKMICDVYKPQTVLDPCAGWGGRLLGTIASGANYIAFEPNTKTYNNLCELVSFLNIENKVTLICDDALNMLNYDIQNVDLVLTSPPYFDLEIYTKESTQSIENHSTYESWTNHFLSGIIEKSCSLLNENGVSCWNVGKVHNRDMNIDLEKIHNRLQFNKINEFSVISSKRQSLQKLSNEKKSSDVTVIYKK